MRKLCAGLIAISWATTAAAQDAAPVQQPAAEQSASPEQAELDAINSKYQGQYDSVKNDADKLDGGSLCLSGTAEWGETTTAFDLPEVTMRLKEFSFNTVKTTFRTRDMSFGRPSCHWGTTRVLGVRVKLWKCTTETVRISTKVPEFKNERTEFSTKIPEFKNKRIEWKYKILKIGKITDFSAPCREQQEAGEQLSTRSDALQKAHMKELRPVLVKQLRAGLNEMSASASAADKEMTDALEQMDAGIAEIVRSGIDPSQVMTEVDGKSMSVSDARSYLAAQREEMLKIISEQQVEIQKQLDETEKEIASSSVV